MSPADRFVIQNAKWELVDPPKTPSELPYPTHSGILELFGLQLKCHRLNTGEAIIEEASMRELLTALDMEMFLPEKKP